MPITRVSFDILTRRPGVAEVNHPEGTDPVEILAEHLNATGDAIDETALPAGVTIQGWSLERAEHRLESDWEEPLPQSE